MPTKKNLRTIKALQDELTRSNYDDMVRDPKMDESIRRDAAYRLPERRPPKLPEFGFFDTASQCVKKIQPDIDYMQELFVLNKWVKKDQKMERSRIYAGWTKSVKSTEENKSLYHEIFHRIGRDQAKTLFGQIDDLCLTVMAEGSLRAKYADYFEIEGPPPEASAEFQSPRILRPRIDWDNLNTEE